MVQAAVLHVSGRVINVSRLRPPVASRCQKKTKAPVIRPRIRFFIRLLFNLDGLILRTPAIILFVFLILFPLLGDLSVLNGLKLRRPETIQ